VSGRYVQKSNRNRERSLLLFCHLQLNFSRKSKAPPLRAVTDSLTSTATFIDGRVLLVGDAVAGLRAHATAGTSQEAMRALLLKNVFENDASMKISDWNQKVLEWDTFAPKFGIQMRDLSQFGDQPQAENGYHTK
jgi:hypothetical protein